ncbi:hypothetical protein C2845_PM08G05300 [Panicum miliaceum]|uniref:Uncharacterized protein n=1 Tax=Panicum miliaceum TaxID=4540 RepID=A0A3L6R211_PANMI|nr:hypothetical protein C2845_PM08G05300 [Panicum miliaceum]
MEKAEGDFRRQLCFAWGTATKGRKAIAKRSKLKGDGVEVKNAMSQGRKKLFLKHSSPCPVLKGHEQVYGENANLRLQLAQKTSELKQEENRRLKLELLLKAKEMESLRKENEELKAENEQLRKNAKPERVRRLCRSCNTHVFHDYRNCPKRRQAASSKEEDAVDAY